MPVAIVAVFFLIIIIVIFFVVVFVVVRVITYVVWAADKLSVRPSGYMSMSQSFADHLHVRHSVS